MGKLVYPQPYFQAGHWLHSPDPLRSLPGTAAGTRLFLPGGGSAAKRTAHQREVVTFTDSSTLPPAAAVPVPSVLSTYRETSLQLPYKSGAPPRSR